MDEEKEDAGYEADEDRCTPFEDKPVEGEGEAGIFSTYPHLSQF